MMAEANIAGKGDFFAISSSSFSSLSPIRCFFPLRTQTPQITKKQLTVHNGHKDPQQPQWRAARAKEGPGPASSGSGEAGTVLPLLLQICFFVVLFCIFFPFQRDGFVSLRLRRGGYSTRCRSKAYSCMRRKGENQQCDFVSVARGGRRHGLICICLIQKKRKKKNKQKRTHHAAAGAAGAARFPPPPRARPRGPWPTGTSSVFVAPKVARATTCLWSFFFLLLDLGEREKEEKVRVVKTSYGDRRHPRRLFPFFLLTPRRCIGKKRKKKF